MLNRSRPILFLDFPCVCAAMVCATAATPVPATNVLRSMNVILSLHRDGLKVLGEGGAEVVALKREFDRRFEEAELVAGIVACAFELQSVDGSVAEKVAQAVGELDLAAGAGLHGLDGLEDFRREHVAPD